MSLRAIENRRPQSLPPRLGASEQTQVETRFSGLQDGETSLELTTGLHRLPLLHRGWPQEVDARRGRRDDAG